MTGSAILAFASVIAGFVHGDWSGLLRLVMLLGAVGLFLSGAQVAWAKERDDKVKAEGEVRLLRERLRSRLVLSNIAEPMVEGSVRFHRLNVLNDGGTTVDDVGVNIIMLDPMPDGLRQRGDIPLLPRGRFDRIFLHHPTVPLNPGAEQAFDFVQHGLREDFLRVLNAVPTLPNAIPLAHYLVTVAVDGKDTPRTQARFWIRPDPIHGTITVEPED